MWRDASRNNKSKWQTLVSVLYGYWLAKCKARSDIWFFIARDGIMRSMGPTNRRTKRQKSNRALRDYYPTPGLGPRENIREKKRTASCCCVCSNSLDRFSRITGAHTKRVRGKSRHIHTHTTPAYMHSVCVCVYARIAIAYWLLGVVALAASVAAAMNERVARREADETPSPPPSLGSASDEKRRKGRKEGKETERERERDTLGVLAYIAALIKVTTHCSPPSHFSGRQQLDWISVRLSSLGSLHCRLAEGGGWMFVYISSSIALDDRQSNSRRDKVSPVSGETLF